MSNFARQCDQLDMNFEVFYDKETADVSTCRIQGRPMLCDRNSVPVLVITALAALVLSVKISKLSRLYLNRHHLSAVVMVQ